MSTLQELGERLRNKRESAGLTHEEVSRQIKVAIRTLHAIEAGDKVELPHLVYTKGFVKSYAKLLRLDPEELGRLVDEGYADEIAEQEHAEMVVVAAPAPKRQVPVKPILFVFLLLAVLAGAWLFWGQEYFSATSVEQPVAESVEKQKQEEPVVVEEKVAQPVDTSESNVGAGSNEQASGDVKEESTKEDVELQKSDAAVGDNTVDKQPALAVPDVPSATVAKATESAEEEKTTSSQSHSAVGAQGNNVVLLTATADCWIEAWGTNFERKELFLREGQKFIFRFDHDLQVRLGNSGGISVAYNGKPYDFDGAEGKVRTLTFGVSQED